MMSIAYDHTRAAGPAPAEICPLSLGHALPGSDVGARRVGGKRIVDQNAPDFAAHHIAHGALDAHTHSDWLCDIDSCMRAGGVDWLALLETLKTRGVLVPAASALTYLAQEIGTPIPNDFMAKLVDEADALGLATRLALLECKPKTDLNVFTAAARGVVKQVRLRRGKRLFKAEPERIWWRARVSRPGTGVSPGGSLTATLAVRRSVGPFEIGVMAAPGVELDDAELGEREIALGVLHAQILPRLAVRVDGVEDAHGFGHARERVPLVEDVIGLA